MERNEQLINPWDKLPSSNEEREKIWAKNRSFTGDVWFRFSHKPTALAGLIMIVFMLLFAFVGPYFTPYDYSEQVLELANIGPILSVSEAPTEGNYLYITHNMKVIEVDSSGKLIRQLKRRQDDAENSVTYFKYDDDGGMVRLDYSEKPTAILDADGNRLSADKRLWNRSYLLGTDNLGRDILTRLMFGTRISLLVALVAAAVNMLIGILYGSISGYIGGNTDSVMMRIVDIINTIPLTLYVILIQVFLGSGLQSIIIALSSVYWVDMARVVRGQVLSSKQQEFVMAARTIGSSSNFILLRHLVPNAMGPILVTVTMLIPSAIFMEAFMSFIGIGISPPMASLGTMCNDATQALRTSPYQLLMPAIVICLIMFAFNFVGDGLRDALDPKLRK